MRKRGVNATMIVLLFIASIFLFSPMNQVFCQETITAEEINFDALFSLLYQFESEEVQKVYKLYLQKNLNREFERFIRKYPETRDGFLQAFNEMLADEELCKKVGCADQSMGNKELLAVIFPGVFASGAAQAEETPGTPVVTPPPVTEQGSIVFLDTSGSMKGYFSPGKKNSTNFQKFLLTEFRNILSSERELVPLNLCRFGMKLSPPKPVRAFEFYQKDFPEANTDIINVFRSEEFYQYPLSIVITDGIQSDPKGGFDSGGVLRAIQEKIDEGFHIYLIGVRSEFDGKVYPEIPPKKSFGYKGLRPMYIWFATRDKNLGDRITSDMFTKLKDFIQFDIDVGLVKLGKKELPEQPQIGDIAVELQSPYHMQVKGQPNAYWVRKTPREDFPIEIPVDLTNPSFDKNIWDLEMLIEGTDQAEWAKLSPKEENQWTLSLYYNKIPKEEGNTLTLKVIGTFVSQEEEWWKDWSTNDDTLEENADKSLYLAELVENLIKPLKTNKVDLKSLELVIHKR